MTLHVELNGRLVPASEAQVSPFDAGYLHGDGVFDTLRAYRGELFAFDEHFRRLHTQCERIGIELAGDESVWRVRLQALLQKNSLANTDARVRIQVTRGGNSLLDPGDAHINVASPVTFVQAVPLPEELPRWQRDGVRAMAASAAYARGNLPAIKSLNYLPNMIALRQARIEGCHEALLFNSQGKLLEGATSNIFLVQGTRLRTPSTRLGILAGITRRRVMAVAADLGMRVEEAASELRDLVVADEVFLTSSVREIVPIVGVDNMKVADGHSGPWTQQLQWAYNEHRRSSMGQED